MSESSAPRLDSVQLDTFWGQFSFEWAELGEGRSGDYDPEDPDDVELLRLDATLENWRDDGDEDEDASYCTQVPVGTPQADRDRLLMLAAETVVKQYAEGASLDKAMQRVSWIHPDWLRTGPQLP